MISAGDQFRKPYFPLLLRRERDFLGEIVSKLEDFEENPPGKCV